ncbi:MAG TPA: hypothetical protein VL326_00950 [Kofleriaceae bacterium]|nr:hypothetical protein [Kofleriaceae bacterium]
MQRGTYVGQADPGPFQCLSCKSYVTGTESGHCPRCGFVPPSTVAARDGLQPIRGVTIGIALIAILAVALLLVR